VVKVEYCPPLSVAFPYKLFYTAGRLIRRCPFLAGLPDW